jgi:hypothetical protein
MIRPQAPDFAEFSLDTASRRPPFSLHENYDRAAQISGRRDWKCRLLR